MTFRVTKRVTCQRAGAWLLAGAVGAVLLSCSRPPAAKPAPGPVPVLAEEVTRSNVPVVISEIGNVEAFSTVTVRSRAGGTVLSERFKEGEDVRRDQLLFEIDPAPYEAVLRKAEADLARDQALSQNAEVEARRYEELVKKDYATRQQADEARARADALQATLKADEAAIAEARLNLDYCSVRSPLDGRTGELITHAGNVVRANDTPLVTIQQVSPIYVSFAVPEINLANIRKAQARGELAVTVSIPGSVPVPERGKLSFVDSQVSTGTGTILLKAVFENAARTLWPGQFVNVSLTLAVRQNLAMVASQAIQSGQGGAFYVFVIRPELTAERRPVVPGAAVGDRTIVEKGLAPGEKVAIDGHMRLADGSKVQLKAGL